MAERLEHDERLAAVLDLIGRSGARAVQIRYDDDPQPTVWVVDAEWRDGRECAGGMDAVTAAFRLVELVVDGGRCVHCRRPSGVSEDWANAQPLPEHICWYVYDPETHKFRRSCEGEAKVDRNAPCPCGSGQKFKRCHGGGR